MLLRGSVSENVPLVHISHLSLFVTQHLTSTNGLSLVSFEIGLKSNVSKYISEILGISQNQAHSNPSHHDHQHSTLSVKQAIAFIFDLVNRLNCRMLILNNLYIELFQQIDTNPTQRRHGHLFFSEGTAKGLPNNASCSFSNLFSSSTAHN